MTKAGSELAATATATAGSPRHHALKYRTPLATPLATVVAAAVATNSDTALHSFYLSQLPGEYTAQAAVALQRLFHTHYQPLPSQVPIYTPG